MLSFRRGLQDHRRGVGLGQGSIFVALSLSSMLLATAHTHSTVFEFGSDGDINITNKSHIVGKQNKRIPETSKKLNLETNKTFIQKLTREVAAKYSGSIGARTVGLDAITFIDLFEALISRESNFNPNIVSPKGAAGLGQLMPDTARDLGVSDPFDPETNLHGSAKYLTQQLEQFGSVDIALAAYNAGPKRVREYRGVPPFDETKSYIKWILAKAGLKPGTTVLKITAPQNDQSNDLDAPLKGNASVWEF